jgi:hypothetical protein
MGLVAVLVAIGVALRLTYYLLNPSLSSDEAALALNLMHRSYSGLFGQLDVNQAAPAGFLVLQKLAITTLDPSPHVLRLLPLVAGIAAMVLFYPVARRLVGMRVAILALALFAVSDPLMTYAATNKQYSIDVAVTLALYAVVLALRDQVGTREAVILALSGAIAVWLSHAATFVLTAVGIILFIEAARSRRTVELARISSVVVVWLGSFAAAYSLTHSSVAHLQRSLAGSKPTLFGNGNGDRLSLLQTYGGMARDLFGIPTLSHGIRGAIALVAIALAVVGVVVLSRAQSRVAALLLMPGAIALLAAALDKYALFPRTFLFLTPALTILAARGALSLTATNRVSALVLGTAAFLLLLTTGAYATIDHLGSPHPAGPVRALRYLTQNARSGDSLYVQLSAQLDFRYYLECGCFGTSEEVRKARSLWPVHAPTTDHTFIRSAPPDLVAGGSTGTVPSDYRSDLAPLRGRARVWVLVMAPFADIQQRSRALATYLRRVGRRQDVFPRSDSEATASVALYDLR